MEWLLKIVEGPMQGAEIALDAGRRVSFGRDAVCDIVVADAGLAEQAFVLDVTDETVTLFADGECRTLNAFEIQTFGTTGFAVGPACGTWEELRPFVPQPPEPKVEASSDPNAPVAEPAGETAAETAAATASEPAPETAEDPTPAAGRSSRRRGLLTVAAVLFALLALMAGFILFRSTTAGAWCGCLFGKEQPAPAAPMPSIGETARSNGLVCVRTNGVSYLSGNLARRTERLAIRALALASDPKAKLDLTDDETLTSSAEALLFTVAEDAVRVVKVKNRRLTISGALPSKAKLEGVLRALSADVPGLGSVDASAVKVGGVAVRQAADQEPVLDETGEVAAPRVKKATPQRELPVAGILTMPYRCVVMRGGARCTEGAIIGGAKLVKIEADCLTFEESGRTFAWKPGME